MANASGSAVITVTVTDSGSTLNGGLTSVFQSFTVTVSPVSQAPSFDTISPVIVGENAGQQTVNLTGIKNGAGQTSTLSFTATSDTPTLIPNPMIQYTSNNPTGTLTFTPVTGQHGTATITVTLSNGPSINGGANLAIQTFTITVTPVNQPPTLDSITVSPMVLENTHHAAGRQPDGHRRRPGQHR